MKYKSNYTEKLVSYIESDTDYEELLTWIQTQPDMEQPEILRELQTLFMEKHEKTGEKDWLCKANMIADGIDEFEEHTVSIKLAKNLFITQLHDVELDDAKIKAFLTVTRTTLIKAILRNKEEQTEIWDLVHKAIKAEKESGLYDPDHWSEIL